MSNRDITKEIGIGMNVAVMERSDSRNGPPYLATIVEVPFNLSLESAVTVNWLNPEKAPHKSRWLRYFKPSTQTASVSLQDIILYDFELTKSGALKKQARDFLKQEYNL